ncbi:MAG: sugar ABC transporter ATP-binding protein [Planctomycetota bacterium]|jgi:ABC-type sugar transport system ATPase subunit|nr:sugar ABC transporter ATP-binding protein [Planctomycetota bacterium]
MFLEMEAISKSFPGVKALDAVTLRVGKGEIHAVVGENGAGKSTLMNILAGALRKDAGAIRIDGREVEIPDALAARNLGIGIVYQNLNMIPDLDVSENLHLSGFRTRGWRLDKKGMADAARERLRDLGAGIDPFARLGSLSIADRQLVAIARAITPETRILILDEPTSTLTPREVEAFFAVVRSLKERGVSLIFISHHLEEIFSVTERVTVLRDGGLVGDWDTPSMTGEQLASAMAGRPVVDLFPKRTLPLGEVVMEVRGLSSPGKFSKVGFGVRAGEILGIGGLVGAGRTEILKTIFGELPKSAGEIRLDGVPTVIASARRAVELGLAYIPEDRAGEGLILESSLADNIMLPRLRKFLRGGRLDRKALRRESARLSERLGIKAAGVDVRAANLSGGNQQKAAVAKWIGAEPRVLLLDEPTRGIDVGAKAEIYKLLGEMAANGVAIVMVSSELPELLAISDRIMVICRGAEAGVFARAEATAEKVMLAAAGGAVK